MSGFYNRHSQFWQAQREKEEAQRQPLGLIVAAFGKQTKSEQLLGSEGPLAATLPGYQPRHQQIMMSNLVERAIEQKRVAIVEAGTGCGKCLEGETIVYLATGERVEIRDLVDKEVEVLAADAEMNFSFRRAAKVFRSGEKRVFRLRTASGRQIVASADHKIRTFTGWKRLEEVSLSDRVMSPREIPEPVGPDTMQEHELSFLALMIADGSLSSGVISYTKHDPELQEEFFRVADLLPNCCATAHATHGRMGVQRETLEEKQRNGSYVLLEEHGLLGKASSEKRIPKKVFRLSNGQIAFFLGRLYSGDGCIERGRLVSYSSASEKMIREVQDLLLRLGIVSRIRRHDGLLNGSIYENWTITITDSRCLQTFCRLVGPHFVGPKAAQIVNLESTVKATDRNPNADLLPAEVWNQIDRHRNGVSWYQIRKTTGVNSDRTRGLNPDHLDSICDLIEAPESLRQTQKPFWDKVNAIEPAGVAETYDITMTGEPNFVANGLVVHNSMAYLVPIIATGKTAVVAPGTIALMEQLCRDLEFLQKNLGIPFTWAKQMGIGNYACNRKTPESSLGLEEEFGELVEWLDETETGDLGELSFPIKKPKYWELYRTVATDSEHCRGKKCSHLDGCYYYAARKNAERPPESTHAHIVVTNHALVATDLGNFYPILPPHEVLVLDEAHGFESTLRSALEVTASQKKLRKTLKDLRKEVHATAGAIERVRAVEGDFWAALQAWADGRTQARVEAEKVDLETVTAAHSLTDALRRVYVVANEEIETMAHDGRAVAYLERVVEIGKAIGALTSADENRVTWVDVDKEGDVTLKSTSVRVGGYARNHLFQTEKPESVILCSATLATSTDDVTKFDFVKRSLGVPKALELQVASPFDYRKQLLYYVPPRGAIEDPTRQSRESHQETVNRYARSIAPAIQWTLELTRGRAFVLFTSYASMEATQALVRCDYPVQAQGEASNEDLVRWFKSTPNAVLFGTSSFWEGVDVPGESLSCVLIDKIPFASPSDPLYQAICELEGSRGAFTRYSIPAAIRHLQQACGRVVRRVTDKGLVVLLDPRFRTKRYGAQLLAALPGAPVLDRTTLPCSSMRLVGKFLDGPEAA